MKVFCLLGDSGDGSSHVRWLDSKEAVEALIEKDVETYSDGDGGSYDWFEVPDGTPIGGIVIETLADIQADKDARFD